MSTYYKRKRKKAYKRIIDCSLVSIWNSGMKFLNNVIIFVHHGLIDDNVHYNDELKLKGNDFIC